MPNLVMVRDLNPGDVFLGPNGLWCRFRYFSDDGGLRVHYTTPAGAKLAWSYSPTARVTLRSDETGSVASGDDSAATPGAAPTSEPET